MPVPVAVGHEKMHPSLQGAAASKELHSQPQAAPQVQQLCLTRAQLGSKIWAALCEQDHCAVGKAEAVQLRPQVFVQRCLNGLALLDSQNI